MCDMFPAKILMHSSCVSRRHPSRLSGSHAQREPPKLMGRKLFLCAFPCPECEPAAVLLPDAGSHVLEWKVRRTLRPWATGLHHWTSYHLRKIHRTMFTPILGVFGTPRSDSLLPPTLPQQWGRNGFTKINRLRWIVIPSKSWDFHVAPVVFFNCIVGYRKESQRKAAAVISASSSYCLLPHPGGAQWRQVAPPNPFFSRSLRNPVGGPLPQGVI